MYRQIWSLIVLVVLIVSAMPGATAPAAAQTPTAVPTLSAGPASLPVGSVLNGVWSSSADDIFIVGSALSGHALILHYDGSVWSSATNMDVGWLAGIWGTSGNDVFAVGPPVRSCTTTARSGQR
jgi:hypothetical protein